MAFGLQTICHAERQTAAAIKVFSPSYCRNKGILRKSWYLETAGNSVFEERLSPPPIFAKNLLSAINGHDYEKQAH